MNAILYISRTGIPWEYLPHDFPPFKAVYDYYAKWEADGTTEQVHDLLRGPARRRRPCSGFATCRPGARSQATSPACGRNRSQPPRDGCGRSVVGRCAPESGPGDVMADPPGPWRVGVSSFGPPRR
ncbi:hypothetical protein GCM10010230_25610 [Streptomyces narbonensis]|nr:hypothetical protein GCM10010230_25610 [Streptomyces narbonensis]